MIEVKVNFKSTGLRMDIAEVARRTGIPAHTLRFYESKGLISSVAPRGARRQFGPAVLDQLALIALGQAGGLSLEEIGAMLSPRGEPLVDRQVLANKADEIDATIEQLKAISRGLRHAAACPAPSHAQCPTFQRLLKAAAAGALKRRRHTLPSASQSPSPPRQRAATSGS